MGSSLRAVTDQIARRAEDLGFAIPATDQRGPHMLGIQLPREVTSRLARRLADDGVVASIRGTSLRIAPHLHTTQTDVDRLLTALATSS